MKLQTRHKQTTISRPPTAFGMRHKADRLFILSINTSCHVVILSARKWFTDFRLISPNLIFHSNTSIFYNDTFPTHMPHAMSRSFPAKQGLRAQSHMRRIIFLSLLKSTCGAWATRHHLLISITLTFSRSTTCCLMSISLILKCVESYFFIL